MLSMQLARALALIVLVLAPRPASAQIVTDVGAVSAIVPIDEEARLLYEHVLVSRSQAVAFYVQAGIFGVPGVVILVSGAIMHSMTDDDDFLGVVLLAFGSAGAFGGLVGLLFAVACDISASSSLTEWRRRLGLDLVVDATDGGAIVTLAGPL